MKFDFDRGAEAMGKTQSVAMAAEDAADILSLPWACVHRRVNVDECSVAEVTNERNR